VATEHEAKDLLARTIGPACHELRSPLAVVFGFAKMLENNDALDPTAKRYIEHVVQGAQRLDELLDALGKTGRIAAGRLNPNVETVSLRRVADDLASTSTNAECLIVDAGSDLTLKADPGWLTEAFAGIVEGLCFEDGLRVRLSWTHDDREARVSFAPDASYPMVDVEPEKASLDIALSRMRLVAMGGSLEGAGDRVVAVIPRA
jgi:K+-sensing histidine kinase KdpD